MLRVLGARCQSVPPFSFPLRQTPFTFSYFEYLTRLHNAQFDVLLCPLLDHPTPRLGKSLIKYLEAAVAGAVGVFSDVSPYAALPHGLTCLKVANDSLQWQEALETLIDMPARDFDDLRRRCLQHVREEFSNAALIDRHEAAWRATEFHARTRPQRHPRRPPAGRARSGFRRLRGGRLQLWRRLRLARAYGIEPVVVIPRERSHSQMPSGSRPSWPARTSSSPPPTTPASRLHRTRPCHPGPRNPGDPGPPQKYQPALVHSATYIPAVGQACRTSTSPTSPPCITSGTRFPRSPRP